MSGRRVGGRGGFGYGASSMLKPRVISLLPAATEIVCALGAGARLVGRSHECDYPEAAQSLPVCASSRIDASAGSAEIDRQVKQSLREALSPYQIDREKIRELKPALILTQAQCEVCAVSVAEVEAEVAQWLETRPRVVSLSPKRLTDIWDNMRQVAGALDVAGPGREIIRGLKARVVRVIEKACVLKQPPGVACLEWLEPLMAAGNWVPDLVELAGGRNLLGTAGGHSPWLDWPALAQADPDVIVVMPCGFDLARTRAEMGVIVKNPAWMKLRAVQQRRVYLTDGSHYFNRPGPRIVESLEIMAELCHPGVFNFGHRGKGWERY